MPVGRWIRLGSPRSFSRAAPWLLALAGLAVVRLSKGAGVADAFALLSRPFWPGTAQAEWLRSARRVEDEVRLAQLGRENERLRGLLGLHTLHPERLEAPVIRRETAGWWHSLLLGRGSLQGVRPGQSVLAPGGLIGLVSSATPTTATVTLLTDPTSHLGVKVGRTGRQGILSGAGTSRPVLHFLEKDPQARPGDVVVTSPHSTLVPPDLPVGVIQSVDALADPAPEALVQLIAPVDAVDWVQVLAAR